MSINCRSCALDQLEPILSLGSTPLANALVSADCLSESDQTYPLELVYCTNCSLVQLTEIVPPTDLFLKYPYFSSFSDTMVRSAKHLAQEISEQRQLNSNSLVMEIASNDGYLLQHYRDLGVPILGIEPAANIAQVAEKNNIPTYQEFFGYEFAQVLRAKGLRPDVIHANNVLAHVPDPNGFVAGMALILNPEGIAVIEVPSLQKLIENLEFDTIYHEHIFYFSLTALDRLFRRHDLVVADVECIPLHGGSFRLFVTHNGTAPSTRVVETLAIEQSIGIQTVDFYLHFAKRVETLKQELVGLLCDLKKRGNRIAAYGASAKGSTLMNVFGIGKDLLDFVVDRSNIKQGFFTPGTHLPILSPQILLERLPDFVLLLTWNFADEILAQQSEFRAKGGQFIIPIPKPRII